MMLVDMFHVASVPSDGVSCEKRDGEVPYQLKPVPHSAKTYFVLLFWGLSLCSMH